MGDWCKLWWARVRWRDHEIGTKGRNPAGPFPLGPVLCNIRATSWNTIQYNTPWFRQRLHEQIKHSLFAQIRPELLHTDQEFEQLKEVLFAHVNAALFYVAQIYIWKTESCKFKLGSSSSFPDRVFKNMEPQNPLIQEIFLLKKRWWTNIVTLEMWKVRSGSSGWQVDPQKHNQKSTFPTEHFTFLEF